MKNLLLSCSDDAFKGIMVGCMQYYSRKTQTPFVRVWEMMFTGSKPKDVFSDRVDAAQCVVALMESLYC